MVEKIAQLLKPELTFNLMLSEDGSGRGAALVAAVAAKQEIRRKISREQMGLYVEPRERKSSIKELEELVAKFNIANLNDNLINNNNGINA